MVFDNLGLSSGDQGSARIEIYKALTGVLTWVYFLNFPRTFNPVISRMMVLPDRGSQEWNPREIQVM
jgi:hypothetical protein